MSSTQRKVLSLLGAVLGTVLLGLPVLAHASVNLGATTSPAAGQAGLTSVSVTGSGFPTGTISAAGVTVALTPKAGGSAVTTAAAGVTAGSGSNRTITFLIPASISVTTATGYEVAVSGQTSTGAAFQSAKSSLLTVDPPALISSISPTSGTQGQTVLVSISGDYTTFVSGATQANFGAGIAVGGGATGANGPVTVTSATHATASVVIGPAATLGAHDVTVTTGGQIETRTHAFTVGAAAVKLSGNTAPSTGQAGETTVSVSGSGFPSGTISPASVTVTLTPKVGGGSAVTTAATLVTPGTGTTSTIAFLVPASITVTTPKAYLVAISGQTAGGGSFQSSDNSLLTIDPPASITSVAPAKGLQGQTISVTITGGYSDFVAGMTQASFGPGISVGGAVAGAAGPVTVVNATRATASIFIGNSATLGGRDISVVTNGVTSTLASGFVVDVEGTPPIAKAGGPYSAKLPAAVQFNGGASYDPTNKKAVLTYSWNFGDGSANGSGVAPTHVYPSAGTYNGTLTVTNAAKVSSVPAAFVATVTSALPVAVPGGPYSVQLPAAVQFNGSASTDPNAGATLAFNWNFGDGTANGVGARPSHTYATAGTYTGSLIVSDNFSLSSVAAPFSVSIAAAPAFPQVAITSPQPLSIFNAAANPITVTGTIDKASDVVLVNGVAATVSGGSFSAGGILLREGQNVITVTATDTYGDVGAASETVTLNTTPPQLGILAPASGAVLTSSTVTVAGNVNEQVPGTINAKQVTVMVNGIAATVSNRTFSAANVPLVQGQNTITVVATDPAGNTSQSQVTVTYMGAIPVQKILLVSGEGQTGAVTTTLPQALVIQVVNTNGAPVPNQQVTFSVVKSDGMLTSSNQQGQQINAVTDQNGQASVQLQLGSRVGVGNNQVSVTAAGFTGTALFCESSTVGPPTQIVVEMGDAQTGIVGQALPAPLDLEVLDAGGNPVAYVPVTFTVQSGGGTLNGSGTLQVSTDINGMASALLVLGQQEGISNNVISATFAANPGPTASFVASSQAAGPASITGISGLVEDDSNTPIPGATITLEGTAYTATSDVNGNFSISPAPVGTYLLRVLGQSSTRTDATFPTLVYNITTVAGINNTLGMPICLPPLDPTSVQTYSSTSTQPVTLQMTGVSGYRFTVYPGSVTNPDGTPYNGPLSLSQVHADRVPMAPPHGTLPLIAGTLQPPGLHFNPPVSAQFPNTSGLAPGSVLDIYSYDHDQMAWISQGPARVSADGSVITSDPGFGISKSGWHFPPPPPPPPNCPNSCKTNNPCQSGSCVNGGCVQMPANDGASCGDGTSGMQCGSNGKCKAGSCAFDSTATNGQSCTPTDKCIVMPMCENGQCTGKPYDTMSTVSGNQQLTFPAALTQGAGEVVENLIPGGFELDPLNLQTQNQIQNCCTQESGPIANGKSSVQAQLQLGGHFAGLPVGPTLPNIDWPFTVPLLGKFQAIISVGFKLGADISLNATAGMVANQCEEKNNCVYGQVNLALEPNIYGIAEAIGCESIFNTKERCIGIGAQAGIKVAINGGIRINSTDSCDNTVQGFASIERPTLYITAQFDLPAVYQLSFQYQPPIAIWPGVTCTFPGGCGGE